MKHNALLSACPQHTHLQQRRYEGKKASDPTSKA